MYCSFHTFRNLKISGMDIIQATNERKSADENASNSLATKSRTNWINGFSQSSII